MAKKFTYRGKELAELQKLSLNEFADLLPARARRSLKRGITHTEKKLLDKVLAGKARVKTHAREMIIIPAMVGKQIAVHKGNGYSDVFVDVEMLGLRLGELAQTRKRGKHSAPGIGATRGTAAASVH